MVVKKGIAGLCAAAALAGALPAHAEPLGDAEKLRRLDIMLMVTSLRCRATEDNFQPDFQAFEAHHLVELNGAVQSLKASLTTRVGEQGAVRALDRISVTMANQYGNGHPWLACRELHAVAHDLAAVDGAAPLLAAADELLAGDGTQLALAPR